MRGSAFIVGGLFLVFLGAGTSDMEVAIGEDVRAFTGVPLALLGLIVLGAGMWFLSAGEEHKDSSGRREEKPRRRAS